MKAQVAETLQDFHRSGIFWISHTAFYGVIHLPGINATRLSFPIISAIDKSIRSIYAYTMAQDMEEWLCDSNESLNLQLGKVQSQPSK